MDSSDKEIIKDNLPAEKSESDEKPSEEEEIEEICQNEILIPEAPTSTQVKPKSELQLENRQKQSTDNLRKESDVNLADCKNIKYADISECNSENYDNQLSPENLPSSKKALIEKYSEQADQYSCQQNNITYSKESKLKDIKASILKYTISEIYQSELVSTNVLTKSLENSKEAIPYPQNVPYGKPTFDNALNSTNFETYVSSEDDIKITDENLLEKEEKALNKLPKLSETENKGDKLLIFTISPKERKYAERVEDEMKRKRNAHSVLEEVRNDESLTDNLNLQDSAFYTGDSEAHFVNTLISTDNTAHGCVKEQYSDVAANQTHQSANKHITDTTGETVYDTYNHQTSNNESAPDANLNSISFQSSIYLSLLDNVKQSGINNLQNEIVHESASESIDRLKYSKKEYLVAETLIKFRDFTEKPETELAKRATEDKPVKVSWKTNNTNTKDSCDAPLQVSPNSPDTNISDIPNIKKILEDAPSDEYLPPQGIIGGDTRTSISRSSPVKLFIDAECDLNRVDTKPESKFINLEQMKNDQEFIESQKQILASIYSQQKISSMKSDSDEVKFSEPLENKEPNKIDPEVPKNVPYRVYALIEKVVLMLKTECKDVNLIDGLTLMRLAIELARSIDPGVIPYIFYILIKHRKRITRSLVKINVTRDRSEEDNLDNDRVQNPTDFSEEFLDKYPLNINPRSPYSSPPKNEPDETSETDLSELKEYPGLARDLTTVKKDARYQKKFYKEKKTVLLPKNWRGDRSYEIKQNTNSKRIQMQSIGDELQIVSEHEDIGHEETVREENSHEGPILLNNTELLKEKIYKDTLSPEEPIKVKKDSRYLKKKIASRNLFSQ